MESKLLFLPILICVCCATMCFLPIAFLNKKKSLVILWSISCAFILISIILLIKYLISVDLKYLYVYSHSSENMAVIYRISSLWAGEEGCFLLWAFIMCIGGYFILFIKKTLQNKVFGIFCAISFFIFLICFLLNPFEKISVVPSVGLGLNEILQSPWMAIHPPLIFLSYSAMAVLFSLWPMYAKNKNAKTIRPIKLWINISMFFLTLGIITGCAWAYNAYESGAVWSWDSLENISLITWLILCGFNHREKYDTQAVCVLPFTSTCFGIFLARSGVLDGISAHAYTESNIIITQFILFLIFGAVLFLDVQRRKNVKNKKNDIEYGSHYKDLASNAIYIYAGFIFLGTIAPIISKAHTSVIYYTAISAAFIFIYSILLIIREERLKKKIVAMIAISALLVAGIILVSQSIKLWWILLLWVCLLPLSLWIVCKEYKKRWKYYLVHTGLTILIVGAVASNALSKEGYALVNPNYNINISGLQISIDDIENSNIIIISKLKNDTVIKCSYKISNSQGELLVPYATKPLIILFWVGCLIVLVQPLLQIASEFKNKSDNSKEQESIIV